MFKSFKFPDALFFLVVLVPTTVAALYFGFLASDIYVSESRFVVRSPEKQTSSALGMVLGAGGIATSGDKSYAVVEYVRSRDALQAANRDGKVQAAYARRDVSTFDRFGGLLRGKTFGHFYAYFANQMGIELDTGPQVTALNRNSGLENKQ